jgi:hypothetical protein
MKFRYGALFVAILFVQSCNLNVTPTSEPPSPASPTEEIPKPTPLPVFEPPEGFKEYQDTVAGVSIYVPENWIVDGVDPGRLSYLQSYPQDKYIGGGPFQPGDTKCDLTIRPPDENIADLIEQWKSGSNTTVISEKEITLGSGELGTRLEVDSMGQSISLFTVINERIVVLSCFGELAPFDEIAVTLSSS